MGIRCRHFFGVLSGRAHSGRISAGFTLAEVVMTTGILALVIGGVIAGYALSARRAEWSAYSLAAQSLAAQGVEQAKAAKWDPQQWPMVDELPTKNGETNYSWVDVLDVPIAGQPTYATNFVSIMDVSVNPHLRQIRADCVWAFGGGKLFTNTALTLRAPDQ